MSILSRGGNHILPLLSIIVGWKLSQLSDARKEKQIELRESKTRQQVRDTARADRRGASNSKYSLTYVR